MGISATWHTQKSHLQTITRHCVQTEWMWTDEKLCVNAGLFTTSPLQSATVTVSQPESPVANQPPQPLAAHPQQTQVKAAAGDRLQQTASGFKMLLAALQGNEPEFDKDQWDALDSVLHLLTLTLKLLQTFTLITLDRKMISKLKGWSPIDCQMNWPVNLSSTFEASHCGPVSGGSSIYFYFFCILVIIANNSHFDHMTQEVHSSRGWEQHISFMNKCFFPFSIFILHHS